jgi:uncharacterized protein (TIGR00369 family)
LRISKVINNKYRTILAEGYPSDDHVMRDLMISLEFKGKVQSVIQAPVVPQVCTDLHTMHVGVIAMLVDILGGYLSVRAAYPDWVATADLSMHTIHRATSGILTAVGSVTRAGRTSFVIEVNIREERNSLTEHATPIGSAIMTFSKLPRREDTLELNIEENANDLFRFALSDSRLTRHLLDKIDLKILDASKGILELQLTNYIRNSFSSLQGGMIAILADIAGQQVARAATGKLLTTSDLTIHYLAPGKTGPFRTTTRLLRITDDTALTRIDITDMGVDNRLISVVLNTATLDRQVLKP